MEENTAGEPMSCLKWTGKASGPIAHELTAQGHQVNPRTVCRRLQEMGFSRRANVKADEGAQPPDRDAPFRYINQQAKAFTQLGDPLISVETKKQALVGTSRTPGRHGVVTTRGSMPTTSPRKRWAKRCRMGSTIFKPTLAWSLWGLRPTRRSLPWRV